MLKLMQITEKRLNLFYMNQLKIGGKDMKKFLLLLLVSALSFSFNAEAQKQYKEFDDDTLAAETGTYKSNYKVTKYSKQVVAFTFTKADVADSLSVAKIQGSNDNTAFYDLADASANLAKTTTDGTTRLYVENPVDLYFQAILTTATGDTVAITDAAFIIKED